MPGLWLRGYAAGYVKKNRELTQTGPYAHTRNPLYLGSMLMAAGFAVALLSWPVALALTIGFLVIYVPVIASEERFLRATFPDFDDYCRRVPRLDPEAHAVNASHRTNSGHFSWELYWKHREYNATIGVALLYAEPAASFGRLWDCLSMCRVKQMPDDEFAGKDSAAR